MRDVTSRFAGKNLLCKLDCLQAYHCAQMAEIFWHLTSHLELSPTSASLKAQKNVSRDLVHLPSTTLNAA